MEHFINVILPIPLEKLFTYSVSQPEVAFLLPGMRVAVPFGKSKIYTALVHEVDVPAPTVYEPKEIHQILDDCPIVHQIQIKHWQWIADYYMCTIGEVFRSAIPSAFLLESETLILKNIDVEVNEDDLKDDDFDVEKELEEIVEPITKLGDKWILGNHVLVCGDSGNEEVYKKLLDNETVDMMITDPPYNVNYSNKAGAIMNDNMKSNDFFVFLDKCFSGISKQIPIAVNP